MDKFNIAKGTSVDELRKLLAKNKGMKELLEKLLFLFERKNVSNS